ncbi:ubiquitin-conjugating enzyme/RWD-like protein [Amylocarpus encephaloides]|uniref:Ubiquitin-conjugating enzyme/RWD-like protein n=1 Tax=Amylocarpus encephaloides TaxID=45428 RepID=A0A9P7YPS2_9HELO|nr:ubiquitin-conjugating enzyme/RWD-like protein [Amylocarpus encephaloides]
MSKSSKPSSSSRNTPSKRVLTELSAFASSPHPTIVELQPTDPSNLLALRAILTSSPTLPASYGYAHGRWLLSLSLPPTYPIAPPTITFLTPICHPNVDFCTGEICLDLLGEAWTPVLGVVGALEAVGRLLGEPGLDSPLGIEVAALGRQGDGVGVRSLVGYWTGEERFEGGLEDGSAGRESGRDGKGKGKGKGKGRATVGGNRT